MRTHFVEATQGVARGFNHGKFLVGQFEPEEWNRPCVMDQQHGRMTSLLGRTGWTPEHVLVLDLETGEGAIFFPGGSPIADLNKHKVWVCPMFEPFLSWLYEHVGTGVDWFERLPTIVELPDAPPEMLGYRREGR